MRQMSYSVCRFWAYDESKKLIGASTSFPSRSPHAYNPERPFADNQSPPWKLALAGSMGM